MATKTENFQNKVTQADLEPKQARIVCVAYDNGRTAGSSSNTGGQPVGFLRYSWPFESKGLQINGEAGGVGQLIGPTTGWTPQFTDNTGSNGKDGVDLATWVPYFNSVIEEVSNPAKTCAAFARYPAPTWRAVKVTSIDPCFVAGIWSLCRLDIEAEYSVYPVLDEETIVKIWCREVETKDGLKIETYDFDEASGEFTEIEWPTWQPYQGATPEPIPYDCFIPCAQKFEPYIADNAVSNCTSYEVAFLCVFDAADVQIEQLAVFQYDCDGVRSTEIYTLAQYNASLDPNSDPLDPTTDQYVLPEGASIKNCDGSDYQPPQPAEDDEPCDNAQAVEICPRKEILSDTFRVCWFADGDTSNCDAGNVTQSFATKNTCVIDGTVDSVETTYTEADGLTAFDPTTLGESAIAIPCIIDDAGNVLIGHETCYKYTVPKVVVRPVKVRTVKALSVAIKTATAVRSKVAETIRALAVSSEDAPVALEFNPDDCLRVTEYCICGSADIVQTTYELVENGLAIKELDGPIEVGGKTLWQEVPCDPRIEVVEEDPIEQFKVIKGPEGDTDSAFQLTIGRPDNSATWSLENADGVIAAGEDFESFNAALVAAGYTTFIAGPSNEAHYVCPCPEPTARLTIGGTATTFGCVPIADIENVPEDFDKPEADCALRTIGCNDDRRDDVLSGILDASLPKPQVVGPVNNCDIENNVIDSGLWVKFSFCPDKTEVFSDQDLTTIYDGEIQFLCNEDGSTVGTPEEDPTLVCKSEDAGSGGFPIPDITVSAIKIGVNGDDSTVAVGTSNLTGDAAADCAAIAAALNTSTNPTVQAAQPWSCTGGTLETADTSITSVDYFLSGGGYNSIPREDASEPLKAKRTIGCLDEQILEKLCEIVELLTIEKPNEDDEGGPAFPEANGKVVSDNFQDGAGNAPFNLQVRNTTSDAVNWQALVSNVPYQNIPAIVANGTYTLVTSNNADGTFNHLFTGTAPLPGFANITITGGIPTPSGDGSGLSLFCEAA